MTDSPTTMDFEEQVARVARYNEETRKFIEESHKLAEESRKLAAEARKLTRDHALSGWQLVIAGMTAGAALIGATAAFIKFFYGP